MRGARRGLLAIVVAVGMMASTIAFAQGNLTTLFATTPAEMKFAPSAPPVSAAAVLVGDPAKPGIYVLQGRIPANTKIDPHTHSELWRIATVLSGTLYYGYGDTFDERKLKALGPGSVVVEPRDQPHFAMTRDEPVTLQLVGEGPAATNPVRK